MKKTLYIITLEPLEQRYTTQWYDYWKEEFSNIFDVIYIDGHDDIKEGIENGRFLDINKTNYVKAEQIKKLSLLFQDKKIKNGDRFIFMDGWHYGITALKYMAQLNKIDIKIYAYWHAGTWDNWDFITQAGLREWARYNELGWLLACDGHFVATQYHRNLIIDYFKQDSIELGKYLSEIIYVVGFPMNWMKEVNRYNSDIVEKKNIIVFPHRLDKEKSPKEFDNMGLSFPDVEKIKTIEVTKDKKEYYDILKKSKISFSSSKQETYGIGTVEAMMCGAIPVVPNRLSYEELYDKKFIYRTNSEMKENIKSILRDINQKHLQDALKHNQERIQKKSMNSILKMSMVMNNE